MNGMILLNTFLRFPVPLMMAAFATVISIYQIHSRTYSRMGWDDPNWVMLCLLALPTSLFAKLWSESRGQNRALGVLFSLAAALIILFLGFYWMRMGLGHEEFVARVLHLALVVHLAIAVLPALRLTSHGFWEYNRFAFTRFIAITIFAAVLYLGLTASLASIDYLFKWHVKGGYYFDLFFLCAFLYHPIAFLSKLPELPYFDALPKSEMEKTRPTDTLCQYVAMPLLALYFLILYLYLIRIIFVWELPRGGIGYLVSGVGLWGILCFLLLDPAVRHSAKLRGYRTLFFVLLSPMLVLLFVGMSVRVGNYGWTEKRYLLAVFGSWLTLITVYFFASRSRDIRFVPITLAIVALATLLGPWSAYELPPYLQRKELERLLSGYEMFREGKITPSGRVLSSEERERISDLIRYLVKTPQKKEIVRWAKEPLSLDSSPYKVQDSLMAQMNLDKLPKSETKSFNYFRHQNELLVPVRGFSYVMNIDDLPPEFTIDKETTKVILKQDGKTIATFDLKAQVERLCKMEGSHFAETLVVEGGGARKAQLRLYWVTGSIKKEIPTLGRLKGWVLLSD